MYYNSVDGQTLVLDEIEKDIPPNSGKMLRESKWTFITQEVNFTLFMLSWLFFSSALDLYNYYELIL